MPRPALLVFTRHPFGDRSEGVKTRLVPTVGVAGARTLHAAFLDDTLRAARASGARLLIAHTGGPPLPPALAEHVFEQRGTTFGLRLDRALADARALLGASVPFAVVGADTPHLPAAALARALDALESADAALGPSTKGGFYLLGFRGDPVPIADVFDAPDECAAVARRLAEANRSVARLEPFWDVDTPGDLERLVEHLAATADELPATRRALAELGLATGQRPGR